MPATVPVDLRRVVPHIPLAASPVVTGSLDLVLARNVARPEFDLRPDLMTPAEDPVRLLVLAIPKSWLDGRSTRTKWIGGVGDSRFTWAVDV